MATSEESTPSHSEDGKKGKKKQQQQQQQRKKKKKDATSSPGKPKTRLVLGDMDTVAESGQGDQPVLLRNLPQIMKEIRDLGAGIVAGVYLSHSAAQERLFRCIE